MTVSDGLLGCDAVGRISPVGHLQRDLLAKRGGQVLGGQRVGKQARGNHPGLRQQQAMAEAGRNLLDVVGDQNQRGRVRVGCQVGQPGDQFLSAT